MADADVGGYATAIFSRPVSFSGDFVARMEFDWNQSTTLGTMFMELRGASGVIGSGGLGDDTGLPGHAYMQVGGDATYLAPGGAYLGGATTFEQQTGATATSFNNVPIVSGGADAVRTGNSLGDTGSARLDMIRRAGQLQMSINDGTNQFSLGPVTGSTEDITSINLIFAGFFYGGPTNILVGDEGTHIAIDSISLEAVNMPGDVEGDGDVDIEDYLVIRGNSFTSQIPGLDGDVNYDGLVDFNDFREWKLNFPGGAAAADAAIAALGVPEPASIILCGVAGVVLWMALGQRSKRCS
jgi:hypothetical protein